MSFATSPFRSQLFSAVREARAANDADRPLPAAALRADILTQLSRGEISVEEALRRLESAS